MCDGQNQKIWGFDFKDFKGYIVYVYVCSRLELFNSIFTLSIV